MAVTPEASADSGNELQGGVNVVRRVGATVVRPAGPHTESVHALLRYVRSRGFTGCPQVLGLDRSAGTETLSLLPGETAIYPLPPAFRTDAALVSAARLLRRYHDATVGFDLAAWRAWFLPEREPVEVVCHGDFAPYNCVVIDGEVVGVFDFDTAHPGPRRWDAAYAAYRWVPLADPSNPDGFGDIAEQRRRLVLFCESYGSLDPPAVVAAAIERLRALVDTMHQLAADGQEAFARHLDDGHDDLYLTDAAYLEANADVLA